MEDDQVKRNSRTPKTIIALILSSMLFTSCSQLLAYRDDEGAGVQPDSSQETVTKAQYDELARKYRELLDQSKNQTKSTSETTSGADAIASVTALPSNSNDGSSKPQLGAESTNLDPSELLNKIDTKFPDLKQETAYEDAPAAAPTSFGVKELNYTDDVDEQINQMREVANLIRVNKFEDALKVLKYLENSKEKQVQVRAKMMLGDLLFNQGEYDLSMQVYEEILSKYAFSGLVLKALGKLVACAEKLKQPEKQAKYYSLLHDFFEAG